MAEAGNNSDLELVERARRGDEQAFGEIVQRHSRRVFHIVGRFFRNRMQIEEAAQDVFLRAYTQLGGYEARGSFEGWLTRIAVNICLNLLRSASGKHEASISDLTDDENHWLETRLNDISENRQHDIEESLIAADLADKLLQKMSPEDRLVLTLIDMEEMSVKEVAELTGWSESKVKVQAFRARRRLRSEVEELAAKTRPRSGAARE